MLLYDIKGLEVAKAIIDLDDVEKCKLYKWHLGDSGYVLSHIDSFNIRLHKFILGEYENYTGHDYNNMTDHKDRNKLNNRKNNLRKVTDSINKQNRDLLINNQTGRTGISYINSNKNKKWNVHLMIDNKKLIDKCYKTREEAEYILDLYELYYKPYCPHYENLKEKYKNIYNDIIKNGIKKYIDNYNNREMEVLLNGKAN